MQQVSEALFHNAFVYAPISTAILGPDGKVWNVNEALCSLTGYAEYELIGKSLNQLLGPDDPELHINIEYEPYGSNRQRNGFRTEKIFVHKNGFRIRLGVIVTTVKDEYGKPLHQIAQLVDSPKLIGDSAQTKQEERLYRFISEHSQDLITIITSDGICSFASPSVSSLLGYRPEQLIGKSILDHIHPGDKDLIVNHVSDVHKHCCRFIHCNGSIVWIETKATIVRDDAGKAMHYVCVSRDVTDRVQAEIERNKSEEQLRKLIEHLPDGVVIWRREGHLFINDTALHILGATDKDQLQCGRSLFHPDYVELCYERAAKVERGENVGMTEIKMIRLDGEAIDAEIISVPTVFNGKPAIQTIFRDITERKRTQKLLKESEKLSLAGQLAAGIAHEIRNPLTSLKGFLQLMRAGAPGKQEHIAIMTEEISRIELIVSELLVLAKPQQSSIFRKRDLNQLLRHVMTLLEPQANMNGVVVYSEFEDSALHVQCDENQLKQVFINILKNAIEAMPKGGEVQVSVKADNGQIRTLIADQGPGIPENLLERLGEPFFTTKETGTGLGLMVSYTIIEHHGGHIRIASEPQVGTTFEVTLPHAP